MLKSMTAREIAAACGCSATKVCKYIRERKIKPVGSVESKYQHAIATYDFSDDDEAYLRAKHGRVAESESARIASGWLTASEIAAKWGFAYQKTVSLLAAMGVESKWEEAIGPYQRKFFHVGDMAPPEAERRHPTTAGDWLDDVKDESVRRMVLDEREKKKLVGRTVEVEMRKGGRRFSAELLEYSMIGFTVRMGGRIIRYGQKEAKVIMQEEDK